MPLKDKEANKEYHKKYYQEHKENFKLSRKKQLDREKIKRINDKIKINNRGYQSQYKDYWEEEEFYNLDTGYNQNISDSHTD